MNMRILEVRSALHHCRSTSPVSARQSSPASMNTLDPNPRSNLRRCRSASPAPPRAPIVSQDKQTLIRRSWQRVPKSTFGTGLMASLASRIGKSSFGEDPEGMNRHQKHFVDLIQTAVENLGDIENALKPWLDLLGKSHAGFHIKIRHWDAFGEALMECIVEWIGPGKTHKETVKAWMLLSTFLADRLGAASRSTLHSPMMAPRLQLMTYVQP